MKLSKPTSDYCIVVKLLIQYYERGLSMKEAGMIRFHKFQLRLSELEEMPDKKGNPRKLKLKIRRLMMPHIKPWGKPTKYMNYKPLCSKSYLYNLYEKLCREGAKAINK